MADQMLIPTKRGTLTKVSTELAQRYYALYKHHLTHNTKLTQSETEYLTLYVKYFEKVSEAQYV